VAASHTLNGEEVRLTVADSAQVHVGDLGRVRYLDTETDRVAQSGCRDRRTGGRRGERG
jgi:hypothetical protein